MSFCCGASKIGTRGTLKHYKTHIHNVPLLFCPVCHHVEVHYLIQHEYEILAEYAHHDGAYEVDFEDYMDGKELEALANNCVNHEDEEPHVVIQNQIDMSLDLMAVATQIQDEAWKEQLKKRLAVLCDNMKRIKKSHIDSGR